MVKYNVFTHSVRKRFICLPIFLVIFILPAVGQASEAEAAGKFQDNPEYQEILEYLSQAEEALLAEELTETGNWLQQAILTHWSVSPLKIKNLVYVNRTPNFYGDVSLREDTQYSPGEVLYLYLEPNYYTIDEQDNTYSTHVTVDVKLILEDGTIAAHNPKIIDYGIEGTQPILGFYMDLSFELGSGIPPGEHTVEIVMTDQLSGEKTTAQTQFTFEH